METMKLDGTSEKVLQKPTEVEAECKIHGKYTSRVTVLFGSKFVTGCPECDSESDKKISEEERAEREANDRAYRISIYSAMNIEPMYHDATFENFQAVTSELKHNLEVCRKMAKSRSGKVVMTGTNGTGKTHLACATLKVVGGKIMTMYEISATIRASYTSLAKKTELEIVDELARVPLLVIDEIGRTKGSDVEANWLSYIIDKRHTRGLPLILATNKHVKKSCPKEGCPDCLENYISEDIMSRITEDGVLLKFSGDDWRRKRREVVVGA